MEQLETESTPAPLPQDLGLLSAEHFLPFTGRTFTATGAGDMVVPLVLVDVQTRPDCTLPNARREAFSLFFTGPLDGPTLDGGLYILHLPTGQDLPPMSINRVVPRPWETPAAWYQAAFS